MTEINIELIGLIAAVFTTSSFFSTGTKDLEDKTN
jgi:hypothetical protein